VSDVVVIGAGPSGLVTAMLLAARGLEVVVLDRDEQAPSSAGDAWDSWERRSITQFHQVHFLQPRGRALLQQHLPTVLDELSAAGCVRFNLVEQLAQLVPGGPGPFDYELHETLTTCRRPLLEYGFVAAARATPGVEIRNGCAVADLVTGVSVVDGVPHVIGVKTNSGEALLADLVVDATGRRTPVPGMVEAVGGQRPTEQTEAVGFVYHTQFYRGPSLPEVRGDLLAAIGSISLVTMPGDSGYWSVTLYHSPADKAMRKVRDPKVFDRVVRSLPLHAHWVDGQAVGGVYSMASTANTMRQFVIEGRPCATGIVPIGDAWAFTNPSLGRGIALGLMHAAAVTPLIAELIDQPVALALAWERTTRDQVAPWHESTAEFDRIRGPEVEAFRQRRPDPHHPRDPIVARSRAFDSARHYDPQVLNWYGEISSCNTLQTEVITRPGVLERVFEVAHQNPPYRTPGPSRTELDALLV
jgi:2-polyprenyl-6-methoxyphenol hydroxylase-like FAD-dependent oxidoreductase